MAAALVELDAAAAASSSSSVFFSAAFVGFLNSYVLDDVSLQSPESPASASDQNVAAVWTERTAFLGQSILDGDDVWWAAAMGLLVLGAYDECVSVPYA